MRKNIILKISPFSEVNHELKTSLATIIGMTHFLEKTQLDKKQREYLKCIFQSAQELLGLTEKIKDSYKGIRKGG